MSDNGLITYEAPGPVAENFMMSNAFVRGIRGPVGSGKTTACIMDMLQTAQMQPLYNGKRHYRAVIIRNTYGELLSTTIPSFQAWVPRDIGRYAEKAPIVHEIDDGECNYQFWFLALDQPKHVKKLLSMEVTQGWLNEAREIPKAILDALTVRVGRYPSANMGGCVRSGVIMDTNSPDTEHWWAKLSDFPDDELLQQTLEIEAELRAMGALAPTQKIMEFFTQPSAEGQDGKQNPDAENLDHLPPGYYVKAKVGKSQDWIKVYVRNEYGFVMDGKPVYPEYRDNLHVMACAFQPNLELHIGMDFGLTPAAVFAQRGPTGQVRVLSELVATRLGAKNFAREIRQHLAERYAGARLGTITGDPAGSAAIADDEEKTVFKVLEAEGVMAKPAHTNDFTIRREAVADGLSKISDGFPLLVLHPECKTLRKGMAGGYQFKRVAVTEERYQDKPNKNHYSHVAEALQYLSMGLGLGKETLIQPSIVQQQRNNRPKMAVIDYDMHS